MSSAVTARTSVIKSANAAQCSGDVCEFLFLFVPTRDLVDDPDNLAKLPVVVEVTLSYDDDVYCADTLEGRLRRADLIDAGE